MASENALTCAVNLANVHLELAKLTGEVPHDLTTDDILAMHERLYNLHMAKGGDAGAAAANVSKAFPGSTVVTENQAGRAPARSNGSGESGDFVIGFGKYKGETVTAIYEKDQGYVRWLADKAQDADVKAAVIAYLDAVDEAADAEDPYVA